MRYLYPEQVKFKKKVELSVIVEAIFDSAAFLTNKWLWKMPLTLVQIQTQHATSLIEINRTH